MKIDRLIKLFKEQYLPKRNTLYSRGDFFWAKQKSTETPEEHWKNLIGIEENCDFPNTGIKPADLLISKFITSITDEKLRDKLIKEKSLTIKQLNEFLKQDSYDKIHGKNLMPKNPVEVKSEPIQKIQRRNQKIQDRECYFCGKQNWTKEPECPGRNSNGNKCNKKGHFAKV